MDSIVSAPTRAFKFKTSNNIYYTKQLFYEFSTPEDRSLVLYTLKDDDHTVTMKVDGQDKIVTLPSIRKLFLAERDPTGYKVAQKYFGGWPHWSKLLKSPWFVDFLTSWQEELAISLAAEQLSSLLNKSQDPKIAQYLLNNGYLKKESFVGRPTKEKILREAEKITSDQQDISDDLLRIESLL